LISETNNSDQNLANLRQYPDAAHCLFEILRVHEAAVAASAVQMSNTTTPSYIDLAADIVSAFVSNNPVPASELPSLIGNVHAALQQVGHPAAEPETAKPAPAVPIKKSITTDYLISPGRR
jgi:hypothetical protein